MDDVETCNSSASWSIVNNGIAPRPQDGPEWPQEGPWRPVLAFPGLIPWPARIGASGGPGWSRFGQGTLSLKPGPDSSC